LTVSVNAAARAEWYEAVAYYNGQAKGLGDAFSAEVRRGLQRIVEYPNAGFAVSPRLRRRLIARFPYSLLYSIDEARSIISLVAIMHHSRDPKHWEDRI
jgi:hypothetical protein